MSIKTFDDLQFTPRTDFFGGVIARMEFENGYGVSVIKGKYTYGGPEGLYELAVKRGGEIVYDTPITGDVLGNLTPGEVTDAMAQVQALAKVTT